MIVLDLETFDPDLGELGVSSDCRDRGRIAGVGIGTSNTEFYYYDIENKRHGLDVAVTQLTRALSLTDGVIGANLMYDIGWLYRYNVNIPRSLPMIDVQFAEALIDENQRRYNLDALAKKYLNQTKNETGLYEWLAEKYGGKPTRKDQGGRIHLAPYEILEPYIKLDLTLPRMIWEKQRAILEREGLMNIFKLECKFIQLLTQIRHRGVRIDTNRLAEIEPVLVKKRDRLINGPLEGVNIMSARQVADLYDKHDIKYPKTAKGNPSFTAPWLEQQDDNLSCYLREARKYDKLLNTFTTGYRKFLHGDILHPNFHPLKSGGAGTVTGRFSSSSPNLQQVPSRDRELAPLIRSCFVPHEGDKQWRKFDYSQVEYRLLAHYAMGEGADRVRQEYRSNPNTDFHALTQVLIKEITGIELDRKPTKNINFGLCYGMGKKKLARSLGLTDLAADELFGAYFDGAPFVKMTFDKAADVADQRGYVRTILGRRRRFNSWVPRKYIVQEALEFKSFDQNVLLSILHNKNLPTQIQRAGVHKALNAILQGSSADIIKKAMVDAWEAGVYNETGLPLIQVHDELNFSDPGTKEANEGFQELVRILETAVMLKVPLIVDEEIGPNWGYLNETSKINYA